MSLNDQPLAPKMPMSFDIVGMPDENFERMCFELVRLEFPGVVKPPNTRDGGADAGLPGDGGGYSRCWQAKHCKSNINWTQWRKSFNDACENWAMEEYTFCVPRELKETERKTFDKHFRQPGAKVKVNYWSGAELHARLTGSEEGLRVARTFFDHSDLEADRTVRAVQAQGQLDTVQDALDRLHPVGKFLQTRDAYFYYPASTQPAGLAGTNPPSGTVMSIEKIRGDLSDRVDIVPLSKEALEHYGPQFRLDPSDDAEAAAEAWPKLQKALEKGRSIELGSGVDVTFTQMPPAFKGMVGQRITNAKIRLTGREEHQRIPPPFEARLVAATDRGEATWDVGLEPGEAPAGWDHTFVGSAGGMTATLLLREKADGGGESMWNFSYTQDDSPAADQLAAMNFLRALSGVGEVVVSDRGATKRPTITTTTEPREYPEIGDAVIALLEDVVTVEDWVEVQLPVPSFSSAEEVHNLATLAHGLRQGGWQTTWHNVSFVATPDGLAELRKGGVMVIDQELWANLAGREMAIGRVRNPIKSYRIVDEKALPDGRYRVRLEPPDADSAEFFQQVGKGSLRRRRQPPPPPPRRGKRTNSSTRTRNKKSKRGSKRRGKRR